MVDKPPSVISIGYGRHLFDEQNHETKRLITCADESKSLHMVIFTHRTDQLRTTSITKNFTLHPTNSWSKFTMVFDAVRIAGNIIRNGEVSIVTTQDPFEAGIVGYLLKLRYKIHLTVQEHADVFSTEYWRRESFGNQIRYRIGLRVLRAADTVRVVSDRIRRTMQGLTLSATITQLPVAIDRSAFVEAPCQSGARHFPADTFTFLTVARFVEQKNFPLMIAAFSQAYQTNQKVRLLVVGKGLLQEQIEARIVEHFPTDQNTTPPVKIVAWSDDIPGLMNCADAYLLSSNYEGWARVLIEAMCCNLPIVTTDVGCAHEVVKDGQHGYVVPLDDVEALATAISTLAATGSPHQHLRDTLRSLEKRSLPGVGISDYGKRWIHTLQ